MQTRSLVSLFSFFEIRLFFPDTDSRNPFCLLTLSGKARPATDGTTFVFDARGIEDLEDKDRRFALTPQDLSLLTPNTRTCPVFRSQRDAELNKAIYRRVPVLLREGSPGSNSWGVRFMTMFHMANDSGLFRTAEQLEAEGCRREGNFYRLGDQQFLPLYEAKMLHHFDHRFSTYEGQTEAQANQGKLPELHHEHHADPDRVVQPRYWLSADEIAVTLKDKWESSWLLGWRETCRNADTRTVISCLIPRFGVGNKFLLMLPDAVASRCAILSANLNSFTFDYAARQKLGGTSLNYFIMKQLPVLPHVTYDQPATWSPGQTLAEWLLPRVLELTFTAHDMRPFARDCGYAGPPFRWDAERRYLLRCELDAAFFHLYGIGKDDVAFIMEAFLLVKKKDEQMYGEYRTRRVILEIYHALAEAARTGVLYQTRLQPPPADPRVAHSVRRPKRVAIATDAVFPSSERDRLLCAALLDLVRAETELPAIAYLDALILVNNPESCGKLLDSSDQAALKKVVAVTPDELIGASGSGVSWSLARDALLANQSLNMLNKQEAHVFSPGERFKEIRASYPAIPVDLIALATKAAQTLREMQSEAMPVSSQGQDVRHEVAQLAAAELQE
jgi:hypothetical protein